MAGATKEQIHVMVVEDQKLVRDMLVHVVSSMNDSDKRSRSGKDHDKTAYGYKLVCAIDSAMLADIWCEKERIDLILMDIVTANGDSGLNAARRIKKKHPDIKIICVTSMPEASFIKTAREIGVDSFWYKELDEIDLRELIERTMAGERIYPSVTPAIRLGLLHDDELTNRELDVLREIVDGKTDAEIAEALSMSIHTVRTHVKNMMEKTGYASRTKLAVQARMSGSAIRGI